MCDLSQSYYCATWVKGNEFMLWGAISDKEYHCIYGIDEITEDECNRLRVLSEKVGGWIHWYGSGNDNNEPSFISKNEWIDIYAAYLFS